MSNIGSWSITAAVNGTRGSPPDYWPEGQAPSTVNNCARSMMQAIRQQWNDAAWFNFYPTTSPSSYVTLKAQNKIRIQNQSAGTTYTATDVYPIGTRLKVVSSNNTVYCTVISLSSSSTAVMLTVTPDSGTLSSTVTSVARSIISPDNSPLPSGGSSSSPSGIYGGVDNMLLNSNFQVAQLGTSFTSATTPANNDDTYLLDQWILLSDGNDIVDVSQDSTNEPTGAGFCLKLDVETANKKFGILQILENKIANAAFGETVSLSFKAKKESGNATLETLRAAIITWDSTADSVTSDVVSAWENAGTNPTLVANWTYENTATNLTLTSSYQTFTVEGVVVDTASAANIAVFIWVDDADATVGDIFYISEVKLEIGLNASAYSVKPFNEDLANCQRYVWKTFPYPTVPAQATGSSNGAIGYVAWVGGVASGGAYGIDFPVIMRTTPTMTFYNPQNANSNWYNSNQGVDSGASSLGGLVSDRGLNVGSTQLAGDVATQVLIIHALAIAQL